MGTGGWRRDSWSGEGRPRAPGKREAGGMEAGARGGGEAVRVEKVDQGRSETEGQGAGGVGKKPALYVNIIQRPSPKERARELDRGMGKGVGEVREKPRNGKRGTVQFKI